MRDYAYYNGVLTPYDAAVLPLSDRSIFFADSVYDVMLGRGKITYQADEHIERLMSNARAIGLVDLPTKYELTEAIESLVDTSEAEDFTLYVQLSGRERRRSHSRSERGVNLLMTVTSLEIPNEVRLVDAITLPDLRYGYCNLKTTNLLPAVLSMSDAEKSGCELAIFHRDGVVTEASLANVSIISSGALITHPLDNSILPGICERNLIEASKCFGLGHEVRPFTLDEMMHAELVLVTSTTKLLKVCRSIDSKELANQDLELAKRIFTVLREDIIAKTS